jgi:hypothetical protein
MLGLGLGLHKARRVLALDFLSSVGAITVLSFKKYQNGLCVKVRRTSDQAEQDFAYSNGLVDYQAIETFVGVGNDGYAVTWYDQSKNKNNAVQTDIAKQPLLVQNGRMVRDIKGNIAMRVNNSSMIIANNDSLNVTNEISIMAVHQPVTRGGGNVGRLVTKRDTQDYAFYLGSDGQMRMSIAGSSNADAYTLGEVNINHVLKTNGLNETYWQNGNLIGADTTTNDLGSSTSDVYLFDREAGDRAYDGFVPEIIICNRRLTEEERLEFEAIQLEYLEFKLVGAENVFVFYSQRQLDYMDTRTMRVYRMADAEELDIGYVNGYRDEQAILDFANGGEVRVAGLYDKTANNNHAFISATAQMPILVTDAGVLLPAPYFNGSNRLIVDSNASLNCDVLLTSYTVLEIDTTKAVGFIFARGDGTNVSIRYGVQMNYGSNPQIGSWYNGSSRFLTSSGDFDYDQVVVATNTYVPNEQKIFIDGEEKADDDFANELTATTGNLVIGSRGTSLAVTYQGYLFELGLTRNNTQIEDINENLVNYWI